MRRALVIGINDYPKAPLYGCVNDANAIAATLETHGDGSPNFAIKLLTSPNESITRPVLREAVEKLFQSDCEIALLYFSGHGVIRSSAGYVVTTDFTKYDEGVAMSEILAFANKSAAKNRVVIIDCCHSGAFGTPDLSGDGLAQLSEGLTVLTASRDFEAALETAGSGVFTSLVVEGLRGGAADLRGHVTPGGVYSYVDQALGAWDQRPIFKTNVTQFTSLRTITPRVPLATLRKLCVYFPAPQDEYRLDPSFEDTTKSPNAANVAVFKDLQKMQGVGLVVPVDEEFMYFAAINSKSCRLTALGHQYWRLAAEKKL